MPLNKKTLKNKHFYKLLHGFCNMLKLKRISIIGIKWLNVNRLLHIFLSTLFLLLYQGNLLGQCNILEIEEQSVFIEDCSDEAIICLPVFLEDIPSYTVYDNGEFYENGYAACNLDTLINYSYFSLLGQGNAGPFHMESWLVDGQTYSGQFENAEALVDSMNLWNPTGNWKQNSTVKVIVGGDKNMEYGIMNIEQLQIPGQYIQLSANSGLTALGTDISLSAGIHEIVFEDSEGCQDMITITVACGNQPPIPADDELEVRLEGSEIISILLNDQAVEQVTALKIVSEASNGVVEQNLDYTFTYTPDDEYCGDDSFVYEVCNEHGCATATVYITVICGEIKVFNGFSPNNDGKNDYFQISGLGAYPNSKISVFNIWGNLVFSSEKGTYKNNWDGTWKGQVLPSGNYFYLIELGDSKKEKMSGWVHITR